MLWWEQERSCELGSDRTALRRQEIRKRPKEQLYVNSEQEGKLSTSEMANLLWGAVEVFWRDGVTEMACLQLKACLPCLWRLQAVYAMSDSRLAD